MKQMKNLIWIASLAVLLTQCQKTKQAGEIADPALPAKMINKEEENKILHLKTAATLLEMAKVENFKEVVLAECLKQSQGDYYVRLQNLLNIVSIRPEYEKLIKTLSPLVDELKNNNGTEPILFYPRAETIEDSKVSSNLVTANRMFNQLIAVVEEEYNPIQMTAPGYVLVTNSNLSFSQEINEEFAWENDVWVIGQEENVSADNLIAAVENPLLNAARAQGEPEYGGIIQVTNLGAIEPWVSGKLEFRYIVNNASGTIMKDRGFGKTKRSNFKDSKVYDYNDFIGNWNTSNIGNWMIEGWIEEDGGNSTKTISQTFPAPCSGCPSTSVSYTRQNKDNDLGRTMIQFSDSKTQWYNITYANIKRK